jgi:hypothetical protein
MGGDDRHMGRAEYHARAYRLGGAIVVNLIKPDAPVRCSSAASPGDIFGVSEPAVGRDPGLVPPAVAA